jgi:mono/diheme cytochrome c family protein
MNKNGIRRGEQNVKNAHPELYWLFLFVVAGCDLPGKPKIEDQPVAADQVVNFDALYRQNCAGCHGADGRLGPAPPLNDAIFLSLVADSDLLRVINEGRSGTPMPPFSTRKGGTLTDAQVSVLARGIKHRWKARENAAGSTPRYTLGSNQAKGDKSRGSIVFARACEPCHGPMGKGSQDSHEGAGAINDPAFLTLVSDQVLRRYAITGRPDFGMPDYADKSGRRDDYQPLTDEEIVDLVALLASWRRPEQPNTPAGQ